MEQRALIGAFGLILAGLVLLVAELFIPSHGILFVLSVCALVFGVSLTFIYGSDPSVGILTLVALFFVLPVVGNFALRYSSRTRLGKKLFLEGTDEDSTVASMPVNLELEQLRGKFGRAISPLRPSGVVDFDGRRVDTITQGMMVEPGAWVRCIDVRAGHVVVRPVDKPDLGTLENAVFE
jgi:membrane-bound serine protease (ClpP class)